MNAAKNKMHPRGAFYIKICVILQKEKVACGFFFLFFSLFSLHSSLFSNLSPATFSREEIKEKREENRCIPIQRIGIQIEITIGLCYHIIKKNN